MPTRHQTNAKRREQLANAYAELLLCGYEIRQTKLAPGGMYLDVVDNDGVMVAYIYAKNDFKNQPFIHDDVTGPERILIQSSLRYYHEYVLGGYAP